MDMDAILAGYMPKKKAKERERRAEARKHNPRKDFAHSAKEFKEMKEKELKNASFTTDEITISGLLKGLSPSRFKELYKGLSEEEGSRRHDPLDTPDRAHKMDPEREKQAKEAGRKGRPKGETRKITYHYPGTEQKPYQGKPSRQQIDSGEILEMEHPSPEEEKEINTKMKSENLELFKSVETGLDTLTVVRLMKGWPDEKIQEVLNASGLEKGKSLYGTPKAGSAPSTDGTEFSTAVAQDGDEDTIGDEGHVENEGKSTKSEEPDLLKSIDDILSKGSPTFRKKLSTGGKAEQRSYDKPTEGGRGQTIERDKEGKPVHSTTIQGGQLTGPTEKLKGGDIVHRRGGSARGPGVTVNPKDIPSDPEAHKKHLKNVHEKTRKLAAKTKGESDQTPSGEGGETEKSYSLDFSKSILNRMGLLKGYPESLKKKDREEKDHTDPMYDKKKAEREPMPRDEGDDDQGAE